MAMASPQPTPPLAFRQHLPMSRPEVQRGRVVEYPIPSPATPSLPTPSKVPPSRTPIISTDFLAKDPFTPRQTALTSTLNKYTPLKSIRSEDFSPKDSGLATPTPRGDIDSQFRPKLWTTPSQTGNTTSRIRKKRLETVNLRAVRRTSKSSGTQNGTSSSCKRSDSTNNDSQKSVLTTESVEALLNGGKGDAEVSSDSAVVEDSELTEVEMERKRNNEKCMSWIETLPDKFSGMYIVQERTSIKDY